MGNQFVARCAQPIQLRNQNVLVRASLPFNSFPVGTGGKAINAIGNFDLIVAALLTKVAMDNKTARIAAAVMTCAKTYRATPIT